MLKMSDSENEEDSGRPFMVPDREVFEITRMGLPLDLKDNLICGLVILLAISLQIRLSGTFWAEGLIGFGGFIGYVSMRYWLLRRRYAEPGELVIDAARLHLPASVNGGVDDSVDLVNCTAKIYVMSGRSTSYSSIVIRHGFQQVKINWLGLELSKLEKALLARNVRVQQEIWTPALYALAFAGVALAFLLVYLVLSGAMR